MGDNEQLTERQENVVEKLRSELFEARVDLKAWIRSMKVLAASVTVLLAILAYFGYNKIESIQSTILERANQRLSKTDSLLARIDEKRLNELNVRLSEKEQEYELTIANFDKLITKSAALEEKLLQSLPVNERVDYPFKQQYVEPSQDYFEVRPFPTSFRQNDKLDVYLTFADKFDLKRAKFLVLRLLEDKEGGYLLRNYTYKVQDRINKLRITFENIAPGKYVLEAGFLGGNKEIDTCYRLTKAIHVQ